MTSLTFTFMHLADAFVQSDLGYVHTWRLFEAGRRLFYIIILGRKPCFQKSPERFLKRQRRCLFLQLRSSFSSEKSLTFFSSEKNALRQAPF